MAQPDMALAVSSLMAIAARSRLSAPISQRPAGTSQPPTGDRGPNCVTRAAVQRARRELRKWAPIPGRERGAAPGDPPGMTLSPRELEVLRLLAGGLTDAEKRDLLATVIDESERLNRFIANLLDMTRLPSSRVSLYEL